MDVSVVGDVEALREVLSAFRPVGGRLTLPLAETEFDQVPVGANPLWEIVRWMPAVEWQGRLSPNPLLLLGDPAAMVALVERGLDRESLARRFAWAIASPADVAWMVRLLAGRGLVEIGAGTGYWAWLLQQAGVEVAAFDVCPPGAGNEYCSGGPYAVVEHGGPEAAGEYPGRALFLSWPVGGSDMASRAVAAFGGDLLFFAGEPNPLVCADEAFFKTLVTGWALVEDAPGHVTWRGYHCRLSAWQRR